jgi:hypothetical protein
MKKTTKKILIGVAILISIIFIAMLSQGKFPFAVSVLSVSNVDVKDNGARILITATPQGTDEIEITFSPSTLNSYLKDEGYQVTKTSVLRAKYIESSKKFSFTDNSNNAVKLLKVTDTGNYYGISTSKSAIISYCKDKGYPNTFSAYLTDTGYLEITNINCVEYYNNGYVSAFNTGLGTDGFKVEWDLDGEKGYIAGDEQYLSLAGGKAKISWVGSLLGINNIGSPNYGVYHIGTSWYLVDGNAYTTVSSGFNSFENCMDSPNWIGSRPNLNDYNACKSTYYNVINSNIQSQNSQYISQVSNAESISFAQGVMLVNLKQPTFKPVFTIELDATKVGLIRLSGIPSIGSCVQSQTFSSAGTKSASATIKNVGSSEGYFDFKIICNNPDMSGHADSLNFAPGESKTVNYQIYGGNSGTTTNSGTCTLTVTDRTSQKSVSCNYNVEVEYNSGMSDCLGTETKCSGDLKSLFKCESGKWINYECTGTTPNCGYESNIAKCVSGGTNGTNNTNTDCKSCSQWAMNLFKSKEKDCKPVSMIKSDYTGFFSYLNPINWAKSAVDTTGLTSQNILCPLFFVLIAMIILFLGLVVLFILALFGIGLSILRWIKSLFNRKKRR